MLLVSRAANPDRWMLSTWVLGWAAGGLQRSGDLVCNSAGDDCFRKVEVISASTSLLVLLAVAGALLTAAFVSFHRRDLA